MPRSDYLPVLFHDSLSPTGQSDWMASGAARLVSHTSQAYCYRSATTASSERTLNAGHRGRVQQQPQKRPDDSCNRGDASSSPAMGNRTAACPGLLDACRDNTRQACEKGGMGWCERCTGASDLGRRCAGDGSLDLPMAQQECWHATPMVQACSHEVATTCTYQRFDAQQRLRPRSHKLTDLLKPNANKSPHDRTT